MTVLTTKLSDIPWIAHGFFTRHNSNAPDIARYLGLEDRNIIHLKQIHSPDVVVASEIWPSDARPEADAIVTAKPGIGIAVVTADCAPVLFADAKNRVVGAAHAGWRGAVGGVLEKTIAEMEKQGGERAHISAAIGPCIAMKSYEVSEGFEKPFLDQDAAHMRFFSKAEKAGHLMFDLGGYVAGQLQAIGIRNIYDTKRDTLAEEPDFYSYRRSTLRGDKDYGRQLSVIAIKG